MMYPKTKRIRLKGKRLEDLFKKVLERDNYTCQNPFCVDGQPLDIPHHLKLRSQGGNDTEGNLITLCVACHRKVHQTAEITVKKTYGSLEWSKLCKK